MIKLSIKVQAKYTSGQPKLTVVDATSHNYSASSSSTDARGTKFITHSCFNARKYLKITNFDEFIAPFVPGFTRTVKFFLGRILDIGFAFCRDISNTFSADFSILKLTKFEVGEIAKLSDFSKT